MTSDEQAAATEQYNALRSGRGFIAVLGWSSVTVSGRDRHSFLQNFCTNDITRLKLGDSCEAFFLNVKGKIIGHGLITCRDEELVFVGMGDQSQRLIEHLDRYIIREDVQLRDSTSERNYIVIAEAASLEHTTASFTWNLIGNKSARIYESALEEYQLAIKGLSDRRMQLVGLPAFRAARIEAGVPLFGVDFDATNFPQEVGRDHEAISFTKGCYLGQETVARIDALGHVNQRLIGVRFFGSDVPDAGTELSQAGTVVGRVTSAAFSPKLGAPLTLSMVRRDANQAGTRLESPVGECEVIELPLA